MIPVSNDERERERDKTRLVSNASMAVRRFLPSYPLEHHVYADGVDF